jgi:hypothetical protein
MTNNRWMLIIGPLLAVAPGLSACSSGGGVNAEDARHQPQIELEPDEVAITYYGQDAFLLADDVRIMIAPHDDRVGYPMPKIEADVVLTKQADRDQAKGVGGNPEIIAESGEHTVKGVTVRGIEAYAAPGTGIIYAFMLDGIRFCHLGGLRAKLDAGQVKTIGPVDVLMIPVGGGDALGPREAWEVTAQLKPRMILPMHYQTKNTKPELGLVALDEFTKLAAEKGATGRPRALVLDGGHILAISKSRLPSPEAPIVCGLSP